MNVMVMNSAGFSNSLIRSGKVLFFGILYNRLNFSVVLCVEKYIYSVYICCIIFI
jgi:hypothetical protein